MMQTNSPLRYRDARPGLIGEPRRSATGFTLLEMVLVIVLLGIVASITVNLLLQPFLAFQDQSRRAALTAEADLALTRMVREIRLALPNSLRISADGRALEFIPTNGGGRYRALRDHRESFPPGEPLRFGSAIERFDVLGGLLGQAQSGDHVVIYNASADPDSRANAYTNGTNGNRAGIARVVTTEEEPVITEIHLASAHTFPFASLQTQRVHTVPSTGPVSFYCSARMLRRHTNYGFQVEQPTWINEGAPLASRVSRCEFRYEPGTHTRNGVVTLRLGLSEADESIELLYQVQVTNAP